MISIKRIISLIGKCTLCLLKWISNFIRNFILSVIEKYNKKDFGSIYVIYIIINIIIFLTFANSDSDISNIVKIVHIGFQTMLLLLILLSIVSNRQESDIVNYLKHMEAWSCAAFIASISNSIFLMNISDVLRIIFIYIGNIMVFLMFYYGYRIFVYKKVNSWVKYTIYFFLLPFISVLIWTMVGLEISDILKSYVFASNNLMKYMIIVITVLIFNLEIYFTPKEKIDEVRVAVYLILAIFSTISYCFFISDYIAQFTYNKFLPFKTEIIDEGFNFSKEGIKSGIDNIIKWVCLPYLIGSVWGCFTLELVNKNINLKAKDT